mmetsp:Transcript_27421/g.62523  ORF Transcript_27421/g.62523 Transcript_27421/m.62523 type:complete len:286 (-) Transcript_27421:462-1319(-)
MLPRIENPNGVYYAWFKHDDPYTGKPGRVHYFYYDSTKENMPTPPRSWRDVADPYAKSVQMVERRVQVVRNRNNAKEAEVERSIRALVDKKNKDDNERLIKARNAGSGGLDGMDEDDDDDSNEDDKSNGEEKLNNQNHMGWLSSEAGMLFLGSKDADGDVVDILQERIGNLTKVLQVNGYKSVLQSADDDGAELNDHQKWHIGQKAIYLREAYKLALEKWGNQVNWMSICTEAIDRVKEFGYSSVRGSNTLGAWLSASTAVNRCPRRRRRPTFSHSWINVSLKSF